MSEYAYYEFVALTKQFGMTRTFPHRPAAAADDRARRVHPDADAADGACEDVYIDAEAGRRLGASTTASHSLRRALTDARGATGHGMNTCQKWANPGVLYPAPLLSGCLRPACVACTTDRQQCAKCTCRDPGFLPAEPATCETSLYQYDDLSGGCVGNADPVGEPAGICDSEALQLWDDSGSAYSYWQTAFGRDGWNGVGGWLMLRANIVTSAFAGRAQPRYVGASAITDYPFSQVSIADGAAGVWLDGHELGHALQYGAYAFNGLGGFCNQTVDIAENHADVHAHRYQGLAVGPDACATYDNVHYNQYRAVPDLQTNKLVGDCHDWLLSRVGSPYSYRGTGSYTMAGLWYATLKEAGPGVLIPELVPLNRAVPMAAAGSPMMQSPGGLTADYTGTTLWNFWGPLKISGWQSFSD